MATPTVLAGSEPASAPRGARIGDMPDGTAFGVTLRVRRRMPLDATRLTRTDRPETFDRAGFADLFGASPADLDLVGTFAASHGIAVTGSNVATRDVALHGTALQYAAAFGVGLGRYARPGGESRGHEGGILLPPELAPIVQAVVGFDDRRAAHACVLRGRPAPSTGAAFVPANLVAAYGFPSGLDGTGQRIGVIGFAAAVPSEDLDAYCRLLGIAPPALDVMPAPADGPTLDDGSGADRDALAAVLQLLAGLAPRAELVVRLAAPTERGCIDALAAAVHGAEPALDVLCLSWAGAEEGWSVQAARAIDEILADAAALGITVCAASGDDGAGLAPGSDTASVSLPASSPLALACGGTALSLAGGIAYEVVWNDAALGGGAGGGGVSTLFPVPSWQEAHRPPLSVRTARAGRGVPDIAAVAAPSPGLLCVLDGAPVACGGTALSAALWAALVARINQGTGGALGFITPRLYNLPQTGAFRDILFGGNETTGRVGGYFARPGWDVCTGLGTPLGEGLLRGLGYLSDDGPGPRAAASVAIGWIPLPGLAHDVGAGPDGTLWALGTAASAGIRPLFRSSPLGWLPVPGAYGNALAVAPDGTPWLADAGGVIRAWDGTAWREHPGRATSLAITRDGTLWIVAPADDGQDGAVRRWNGSTFAPTGASARHVRAGPAGPPLLLTGHGEALRSRGTDWSLVARNAADIAADVGGRIWAVSRTGGRIWCLDALDASWREVPGAIARRLVPLRDGGLLAIQRGGRLFIGREATREGCAA
jgi:kumamolisin